MIPAGQAAGDGPGLVALLVVLAVTAALALWWRTRQGRVAQEAGTAFDRSALDAPAGVALLVEFTAPGCAPCAAARGVLEAVVEGRPDAALVTVDVGANLELARAHGILRAPTTLLVDAEDRVRHRVSGVPSAAAVSALLDGEVPARAV